MAQWSVDPKANLPISCCKDTAKIQWISLAAILEEMKLNQNRQLMDSFWGYEVVQVATPLQQMHQGTLVNFTSPQLEEFTSTEVMKYLSSERTNTPTALFSQMLHEAKFTEKDVIKVYCDYVQHCYPSGTMTFCSFCEYFTKIGFIPFDDASLRSIFRYVLLYFELF